MSASFRPRANSVLSLVVAGGLLTACGSAVAQHANHGPGQKTSDCAEAVLRCATKVTPVVGPDDTVWLAFQAAGRIMVTKSTDVGRTTSEPIAVTPNALDVDWGPDARPKIAIDAKGEIHVAFAVFKDKHFNGQVFHARSTDGGKSFATPAPVTNVQESQRFETLAFAPDGRLFAAWLDKRNRVPARARGEKYMGAALAFAWADATNGIGETVLAQDNTCECCRIGVAFAKYNRPLIVFRNIFEGGIRDHGVIAFKDATTPGPVRRVAVDGWKTDACPHHGPALAIGEGGALHVAWYTNGTERKGLFYARSADEGQSFGTPMPIGAPAQNPSRPSLLALDGRVHLVWKEFDGKATTLVAMTSTDGGLNWGKPETIAATSADSDQPLAIAFKGKPFVSWHSQEQGWRLVPVGGGT